MIFLELFITFFFIGIFGFGGGYGMLSLIQNEVVVKHQWMTASEFTDIVAISQMTPGPIAINSATYIGYTVAGVGGSVVATLAVCLPALTVMLALTKFFIKLKDNHYVHFVVGGMKPVVVGMIAAAALLLIFPKNPADGSFIDGWSWVIFIGVLLASVKRVNPILLIVLSAVVGVLIYGV